MENGANNGASGDTRPKKASPSKIMKNRTILIGQELADDFEPIATSGRNSGLCRSKMKWAMGLLALSILIVVSILSFSILSNDNDDLPLGQNSPFQRPSGYNLFATKTLYSTAFNYINKPSKPLRPTSPSSNNVPANQTPESDKNYVDESVHLPSPFLRQHSLQSLDRLLTSPQVGCSARELHFIGRHGVRLPSDNEILTLTKLIQGVQSRIDVSRFQVHPAPTPQSPTQDDSARSRLSTRDVASATLTSNNIKPDPICSPQKFKDWSMFARPGQGDVLTETGARETAALAQRFKLIYPELFDASKTDIAVVTTKKLRTAQTAINFLEQVDSYKPNVCEFSQFPRENAAASDQFSLESDQCYRQFISEHENKNLSFHHLCDDVTKNKDPAVTNLGLNLTSPSRTESIRASVSAKLKLSDQSALTPEETKAIYDICRYESALTASDSIWCCLFTAKDLQLYEYLTDINDYFNSAYGEPYLANSACPITQDILKSLFDHIATPPVKSKAKFSFTHSEVIQRIFAAGVDLSSDPAYDAKTVLDYLDRGEVPSKRDWQTSLLTPFSANIAFTLYHCPNITKLPADLMFKSENPVQDFDVSRVIDGHYKVVASLNERPILLEGCPDYVCDWNRVSNARIVFKKPCNMTDICKKRVKII